METDYYPDTFAKHIAEVLKFDGVQAEYLTSCIREAWKAGRADGLTHAVGILTAPSNQDQEPAQ